MEMFCSLFNQPFYCGIAAILTASTSLIVRYGVLSKMWNSCN